MGNIHIVGPRGSGKTTYLAALAYWPDKTRRGRKVRNLTVQPVNDEARELVEKAENIILQGESLEPTLLEAGGSASPYSFLIEVKPWFQKTEQINLVVRDYPGEIFDELADSATLNPAHQELIDECFMKDVVGCLILLTDWQKGTDKFYSRVLEKFTKLMDSHDRARDLRVAVAMSKCERGELWPGRLEPKVDLFDLHLQKTKATLEAAVPAHNLRFYAISTFGVLGRNDPRPNRVDVAGSGGHNSVLREPERWRPHGLFSPLYWLNNGKGMGYV